MKILTKIPIRIKLLFLLIIVVTGLGTVGYISYNSLDLIKTGLTNVYFRDMIPIKELKTISDYYTINIIETIYKTQNNIISIRQGREIIKFAQKGIQDNWQVITKKYHLPEEEHLISLTKLDMIKADYFIEKVLSFYNNEDIKAINDLKDEEIFQVIDPVRNNLAKLIDNSYKKAMEEKNITNTNYNDTSNKIITIYGIIISLVILLFVPILNSIRGTQKELELRTKNLKKLNLRLTEEKGHLASFIDFLSSLNTVDLNNISVNSIKRIVHDTNSQIGLFYHYENSNSLRLIAKECVDSNSLESEFFSLSSKGLPKRAIEEKCEIMINNFDEIDMPIIDTGLLKVKIKRITAFPLIFNDQRLGVIILASISNTLNIVENEYLKGYISSLSQTLNNALAYATIQIQSEKLKQVNERLRNLSITDPLTKLYNRRYLDNVFKRELDRVKRDKKHLSFMMLDIDYFKQYNDTYGHPAGDEVLQKIAHFLTINLRRPGDFVFRIGGEEFGALFIDLDQSKSIDLVSQIISGINELNIKHETSKVIDHVTVSIGLIVVYNDLEILQDEVVCRADLALYKAKHEGRNRFVLWNKDDYTCVPDAASNPQVIFKKTT
ncbi:MAG: diguanylate cyclase [Nitrospirae bacterium]|nr:diguanylate cyclase [Nitrospirota bacterium]